MPRHDAPLSAELDRLAREWVPVFERLKAPLSARKKRIKLFSTGSDQRCGETPQSLRSSGRFFLLGPDADRPSELATPDPALVEP